MRNQAFKYFFIVVAFVAPFLPSATFAVSSVSVSVTVLPATICSDGIDNDSDTKIDYPNDPGCSSFSDTDETDPVVTPPSSGGGGGGGGGGSGSSQNPASAGAASMYGKAFPFARIITLVDGVQVASSTALADGTFSLVASGIDPGVRSFSVYGLDGVGGRTAPVSISTAVNLNTSTNINGIVLSPTITTDKSEVKKGETVTVSGYAMASSSVYLEIKSASFAETIIVPSDRLGAYSLVLDTKNYSFGSYAVKAYLLEGAKQGPYSRSVGIIIGSRTLSAIACGNRADVNGDCKVNLVDFSIVAYWYKRTTPPALVDLNGDGKISLIDFSILAFNWTG